MFSGQGSQYPRMGKDLYEGSPVFREWMDWLDQRARREAGASVVERLYGERSGSVALDETELTHPAIFMVEYALAQTLISSGIRPDMVLGSSLGEVAAAAVAGAVNVEEGLRFVIRQARVFNERCPPGGMMVVLHSPRILAEHPEFGEDCELAAINGAEIFVVSGTHARLARFESFLKARDIATSLLPVSHAFHSRLMEPARREFLALTGELKTKRPLIPMMSCTHVAFAEDVSHDYFWNVVRRPIDIAGTLRLLSPPRAYAYLDVSPSGSMSNMVKYNGAHRRPSPSWSVLQRFGDGSARLRTAVEDISVLLSEPQEV